MDKQPSVDYIELEFFGSFGGGYYTLRFNPDGSVKYNGELSMPLHG